MPQFMRQHAVHITADNTDVFVNSAFQKVLPQRAKTIRVQVIATDYDCKVTLKAYDEVIWDDCAALVHGADNAGSFDYQLGHAQIPVKALQNPDLQLNVNVTTGTAIAFAQFEY